MRKSIVLAVLATLYIVLLAGIWGVSESGSHTSLEGELRSDWKGWYLFGKHQYLGVSQEYEIDEYSGPEGLYIRVYSYFTYHDEPFTYYIDTIKNKQKDYTLDLDVLILGVSICVIALIAFSIIYKSVIPDINWKWVSKKSAITHIILLASLALLAVHQIDRIENPKWRIQDEIVIDEHFIEWAYAIQIINTKNVVTIMQAHSRVVSIILDDGSYFSTLEPSIDEVYDVIDECGEKCNKIALWTE